VREIKFRAWIIAEKRMVNVAGLGVCNYNDYPEGGFYDDNPYILVGPGIYGDYYSYDMDDVEMMQYTGLKDKNGVEIYEGDIIYYHANESKAIASLKPEDFVNQFVVSDEEPVLLDSKYMEVIGNIYENPELLAEKKEE
jgi:hypothetical protein